MKKHRNLFILPHSKKENKHFFLSKNISYMPFNGFCIFFLFTFLGVRKKSKIEQPICMRSQWSFIILFNMHIYGPNWLRFPHFDWKWSNSRKERENKNTEWPSGEHILNVIHLTLVMLCGRTMNTIRLWEQRVSSNIFVIVLRLLLYNCMNHWLNKIICMAWGAWGIVIFIKSCFEILVFLESND